MNVQVAVTSTHFVGDACRTKEDAAWPDTIAPRTDYLAKTNDSLLDVVESFTIGLVFFSLKKIITCTAVQITELRNQVQIYCRSAYFLINFCLSVLKFVKVAHRNLKDFVPDCRTMSTVGNKPV